MLSLLNCRLLSTSKKLAVNTVNKLSSSQLFSDIAAVCRLVTGKCSDNDQMLVDSSGSVIYI